MRTNTFSINAVGSKSEESFNVNDVIRSRFDFSLAVVKTYIRFLQEVENMGYEEASDKVMSVANKFVEMYNFGDQFIIQTKSHLMSKYRPSPAVFKNQIRAMSNIEDVNMFMTLQTQLKDSNIFGEFSDRFKMLI